MTVKGFKKRTQRFLLSLCKCLLALMIIFVLMILSVTACQAEDEALKEAGAETIAYLTSVENEKRMEADKAKEVGVSEMETTKEETEEIATTEEGTEEVVKFYYDVPLSCELQDYIFFLCEDHGIDPAVVIAMIERESRFTATAIGDSGNSFGLMQIQPRWHSGRMEKLCCPNLLDPLQNVKVGIDYLAEMLEWYDGDMAKALTAYNQGYYAGKVTNYATAVLAAAEELNFEKEVDFE